MSGGSGTVITAAGRGPSLLNHDTLEWAAQRGLSAQTLEQFPVASGTVFFPALNSKSSAIFFRYTTGWKARAYPVKSFVCGGDFRPAFWNLKAVTDAKPGTIFITEGELDALSLAECGLAACQILSVPTGARQKPSVDPGQSATYQYVFDALRTGLANAQRIVWCGDGDEAGLALRADMVRLFGPARFAYVEWPAGINDPNAMLQQRGALELRNLVLNGHKLWPQSGLYRLSELPTPPPLTLWRPAIEAFHDRINFAPRTLSVVTGQPGHGKTQCMGQILFGLARDYDLVLCVASFETRPKPHLRRQLRTLLTGRLEIESNDSELAQADDWIEQHYLFLVHDEQRPTLEWLLECAEVAIVRHGAKIVQIDPWNRLEASRGHRETETEYVLRCLRALYVFANDMDCHVQVIAHPAKMDGHRRGQAPTLEDVSASKHWENIVDQGFTIHRPQMYDGTTQRTQTEFYHRKARFSELGYPCRVMLDYDLITHRYVPLTIDSPDYP